MDPKRRASFINSVASGMTVPCPNCGTANKSDEKNCIVCGAAITTGTAANVSAVNKVPAFAPVGAQAEDPVKNEDRLSVFAEGLPEWDVVPPQIMVRRTKSK